MIEIFNDPDDEEPETVIYVEGLEFGEELDSIIVAQHLLLGPDGQDAPSIPDLVVESHIRRQQLFVIMDRNIVSYLVAVGRGVKPPLNVHRSAIALLAKLQLCGIESEPGVAYHEYAEHSIDRVPSDLEVFRKIDGAPLSDLVAYALGKQDKVTIPEGVAPRTDGQDHQDNAPEDYLRRLTIFEYNILTVKKAYCLAGSGASVENVMRSLLLWMEKEYLFTAGAFLACLVDFSPARVIKTMKNASFSQVRNRTWDLAVAQYCRQQNHRSDGTKIYFLSSNDVVVRQIYRLVAIEARMESTLPDLIWEILGKYWSGEKQALLGIIEEMETVQVRLMADPGRRKRRLSQKYVDELGESLDIELKSILA